MSTQQHRCNFVSYIVFKNTKGILPRNNFFSNDELDRKREIIAVNLKSILVFEVHIVRNNDIKEVFLPRITMG